MDEASRSGIDKASKCFRLFVGDGMADADVPGVVVAVLFMTLVDADDIVLLRRIPGSEKTDRVFLAFFFMISSLCVCSHSSCSRFACFSCSF